MGAQAGELGYPPRARVEAHAAVARQSAPVPGAGDEGAVLLVAVIVVRLALVPVVKAGSITPHHAAAPPLGRAEPRLVLVEPEPQALRRGEPCRDVAILFRRADAGRCAPVLLAELHAAEERRGALGRHFEAGGAGGRGSPADWTSVSGAREEEEQGGGGSQHLRRPPSSYQE